MGSLGAQANGQTNGTTHQPLDWTTYFNIIDGELTTTSKTRHGINPATGKPNPEVPVATQEDVEKAMLAAKKASKTWAEVPYAERQKAVLAFADALEAEHQAFSSMLTQEQGKPVSQSRRNDWILVMFHRSRFITDAIRQDGTRLRSPVASRNCKT